MCAIMGYTGTDIPVTRLEKGFAAARSRGPDASRTLALPAVAIFSTS